MQTNLQWFKVLTNEVQKVHFTTLTLNRLKICIPIYKQNLCLLLVHQLLRHYDSICTVIQALEFLLHLPFTFFSQVYEWRNEGITYVTVVLTAISWQCLQILFFCSLRKNEATFFSKFRKK